MKIKRALLAAVAVVVGLPLLLVLGFVAWYLLSDRTNGSIVSAGEARDYLLYVPDSYDPATPTPVVISMHGTALWPALQRNISRWNTIADEYGFIVVYPGAQGRPQRKWELDWAPGPGDRLEAQLISDLIDTLQGAYRIDASRIYADGLSAGGMMALVMACRLPDRIAAIAAVVAAIPSDWCDDPRPVPLLAIHGKADPLLLYEGGQTWVADRPFEAVEDWMSSRARENRCASVPVDTQVSNRVLRRVYTDCAASLVHYAIDGGGHQWPGGMQFPEWMAGPPSDGIDATRTI